jgi:glutathione S-transferase
VDTKIHDDCARGLATTLKIGMIRIYKESKMLKLYYSPGACSLAAHIILEELQLPYEAIKVDLKTHKYGTEDYFKINILGAVPVLALEDGSVISQNAAILTYLAELDPKHQLMPVIDAPHYIRCHEWLGFLNSDVHKAFGPLFKPNAYVQLETAQQELKENAGKNIVRLFSVMDKYLVDKKYALGDNYSIIDPYLLVLYRWVNYLGFPATQWSNYHAVIQQILQRPAVKKTLVAEGLTA